MRLIPAWHVLPACGGECSYEGLLALQKCSDSAFCNRLMGSVDEGYMIDPASVKIAGSKLLCRVQNTDNPDVNLELALTSYGGFIRLHINEDASKGRFEVPGVLQKDLAESESAWEMSKAAAGYALLKLGSADIRLKYKPLELTVDIAGKPAIVFNGRHMFNFEHLRQKKVCLQALHPQTVLCITPCATFGLHICTSLWWGSPIGSQQPMGQFLPVRPSMYGTFCRRVIQKVGGRRRSSRMLTQNRGVQRPSPLTLHSQASTMCMVFQSMPRACH